VFEPEARFTLAVIEETRALADRKRLDTAQSLYQKVADDFKESGYAKLAVARLAVLKDEQKRAELVRFYQNLSDQLGMNRLEPKGNEPLFPDKNFKLSPPPPPAK